MHAFRTLCSRPFNAFVLCAAWFVVVAGCPRNPTSSNNPPTASAGGDQVVNAGASVTLDGSASSDPEGDALAFTWTQIAGPPVVLSSASDTTIMFAAPPTSTT